MAMADWTVYRFITDHLGSVRLVVNVSTGTVARRIDYDGFGKVLTDTNPGFPFGRPKSCHKKHHGFVVLPGVVASKGARAVMEPGNAGQSHLRGLADKVGESFAMADEAYPRRPEMSCGLPEGVPATQKDKHGVPTSRPLGHRGGAVFGPDVFSL